VRSAEHLAWGRSTLIDSVLQERDQRAPPHLPEVSARVTHGEIRPRKQPARMRLNVRILNDRLVAHDVAVCAAAVTKSLGVFGIIFHQMTTNPSPFHPATIRGVDVSQGSIEGVRDRMVEGAVRGVVIGGVVGGILGGIDEGGLDGLVEGAIGGAIIGGVVGGILGALDD